MKYVLAIIAFVIATPLLGYAAFMAYMISPFAATNLSVSETPIVLAVIAVALLVGIGFLVAGVAVLSTKPRREK